MVNYAIPTPDCDGCKKPMVPVNVHSQPKSSELYCPRCHKSKSMDEETAGALNQMEMRHRVENNRK